MNVYSESSDKNAEQSKTGAVEGLSPVPTEAAPAGTQLHRQPETLAFLRPVCIYCGGVLLQEALCMRKWDLQALLCHCPSPGVGGLLDSFIFTELSFM